MSNPMPIYSHVVPKSQYRKQASKNGATKERSSNLPRTEFDPLNYNHGGQFHLLSEPKYERPVKEARRSKEDYRSSRRTQKVDPGEGKVEAYLRQNQVSIRQQQHRHSAVRQAEHRVNLRSLPLNDVVTSLANDRTPSDRHRPFPEREGREGREGREHRRERDKERDREHDATPLSPNERRDSKVRKSTSSHKVTETGITTDKRRFFCREWAFQKIAHCLEQRPVSKTCGALILGEAGSGKTALCQELSAPGGGPQARQQRALARRLLARHFLQGHQESSLRPGEFVRSIAMQILSHSSRHNRLKDDSEKKDLNDIRNSEEELLIRRFKDMGDDGEDSSKPLLADSEDQRTDDEEPAERRSRTIDRLTEREAYLDAMIELPEILPRNSKAPTNPFLTDDQKEDFKIYENHENLFLRNLSQRQSKEIRNSRLLRQSSEPLNEKKPSGIQKSLSTDQKNDSASENEKSKSEKSESSPPRSRIPVASFRYPNKSDLRSSSVENSPSKSKEPKPDDVKIDDKDEAKELPEYTNILKEEPNDIQTEMEKLLEKKRAARDDVPPPIPSLPVSPRTLIANAYYDKLLSEPEIQQALLPQNLEKNPDECFKKALLFPLLEIDPPKQCLFLMVDAIDEGTAGNQKEEKLESTAPSNSILCLLSRHQHLFPQWLLPVCTSRRKPSTDTLTGFRKITLDELQRAHVSADVQRYVLARLDTEPRLRARVSSDSTAAAAAAAALDHLRIKSDGCLLYLEKVLDGVADGFIGLREIKEIPGTLNGLYLWLAQRLFHGRRFTKVRPLLDVLLASRCGVTQEMLYKCLLTKEYSVTREDFHRRLHALRRILVMESTTGHLQIFHHSFAKWLLDVKHCTRRYLCDQREGDATLAMYYTLDAKRLSALEIHNYVYHMTNLEAYLTAPKMSKAMSQILSKEGGSSYQLPPELDWHTIHLLWVLDSGCDVDCALKRDCFDLQPAEVKSEEKDLDPESEGKESISVGPTSSLESIMPSLVGTERFPREAKVLRALREMCNKKPGLESPPEPEPLPSEELSKEDPTQQMSIEPEPVDPAALMQLLATGDDHGFVELLKTCPALLPTLPDGGSSLLSAAARGGLPRAASALLAAGVSPVADSEGCSPLRAAAWAGHTEVVEVLLEYNAEVDCVDADNRTALRAAAWSGHEAVVTRLLAANASPDLPDGEGRTALIAAAYMGHADIVKALLDAGAKTDHADEDGRTALAVASLCASGAACAAILIERGADVNKPDRDKATPLLVAAFEGHTEICELLLEAEADIEASDACGRTALWAAASAGHAAAVRVLLFWGACVDSMDAEGRTVLSTAAAQGNVEVVRQLLDRGLDEHHRDNSGWTPLHYAAFEGHVEVCEALLEAGAKVDAADNDGKGALMLAAQEGHSRLLETLADDWAAPVDQRAHDGKTALRLAALEGHFDTVRALYERGADVDAVDADKRSTLYVLAIDNRLAMARYLICECGASVDIRDAEGRTPLHVSAWQGHTDMVNLLIKVGGADVDGRDRCLRTALHAAAWRGRAAALRALLQHQAAPAAVCTQGATPLGIAAQEGHEECVMWLLQYGADPLQADHCGRTPAKVAWRAGHANICRLLERFTAPSAPAEDTPVAASRGSPDYKRRSVHSSNSTKSSSNLTATSTRSHHDDTDEKASRAHLSLSFAQQVARCGRRERDRDNAIPEHRAVEQDANLRSYLANEKDFELRNTSERDRRRDQRHLCDRESTSPLYASPPHSPLCSPVVHDNGSQPASLTPHPAVTDQHFNRDTHMRIILGRDSKPPPDKNEGAGRSRYTRLVSTLGRARGRIFKKTKGKRNGIVTNPAMRLVNNVKNGLDSAAANIRRTGVALAASAGSNNPAVKSNAFQFQWRRETPL